MLKALLGLLKSTEQLTTDVDSRNTELAQVGRSVGDLHVTGELQEVQHELLRQIAAVIESNHRLEDDLVCTRYRLEEQARELDRTREEARTDTLSGTANRKSFDEALQFLVASFNREGTPFALVLADVDHFKWINDTHGHPAGDRVVEGVGEFLNECIREGDIAARYGGDEFTLLLPHVDREAAARIADRIRVGVERRNFDIGVRGERVSVTFSMGLAAVRQGDTFESVLQRADKALYRSKQSGRNQLTTDAALPDESELAAAGT
jgi:diguanylate cyclase (GGDEF)-like protein